MRPRKYPYSFKPNLMNILDSRFYTRLIVETEDGAKKIAEVTLNVIKLRNSNTILYLGLFFM
ncbi:Uncharacterised protein [Streptococcus pneumoniae]|nr:Uncharacterised protein [Streptococcus pneumoniae]